MRQSGSMYIAETVQEEQLQEHLAIEVWGKH